MAIAIGGVIFLERVQAAIPMVSVWAGENRLVLGHTKVADKPNEITGIPQLLALDEVILV